MAKTHTSTAVKRRYNEKVYHRITIEVPKELAAEFKETCAKSGVSQRQVVIRAMADFVEKN